MMYLNLPGSGSRDNVVVKMLAFKCFGLYFGLSQAMYFFKENLTWNCIHFCAFGTQN